MNVSFQLYKPCAAIFLCCVPCNSFHQKTSKFFVTLIVSKTFISLLDLDTKPCLLSPCHTSQKIWVTIKFMQRASEGSFSMCLRKRPFNIWWIDQHFFWTVPFFSSIFGSLVHHIWSLELWMLLNTLEDTWKTFRLDSQDSLHCLQELFSLSLFWLSVFKIRTPNQLHVENVFLCIYQNQFKYCKKFFLKNDINLRTYYIAKSCYVVLIWSSDFKCTLEWMWEGQRRTNLYLGRRCHFLF